MKCGRSKGCNNYRNTLKGIQKRKTLFKNKGEQKVLVKELRPNIQEVSKMNLLKGSMVKRPCKKLIIQEHTSSKEEVSTSNILLN